MTKIIACQNCRKRQRCTFIENLQWWLCNRCIEYLLAREDA